jgi:hypothetical protein
MPGRLTCLLLALAAAALAAAVPAAPAQAFQVGIQDDSRFVTSPPGERERALDRARAIGASYIRITMIWESYREMGFRPYDAAVNAARARGMTVHLNLTGNPWFVNGGRGYIGKHNPSPARMATWAATVARHFRGRIPIYSIWNEGNLHIYLSPQNRGGVWYAPRLYRRLYERSYRAIKRADRRARVLIGETAPSARSLTFLSQVAAGRRLVTDGWAHHPYQMVNVMPGRFQRRYPGGISNIGAMRALVRRLARERRLTTPRGGPVPLYFTEFAYPRPGWYYGYFSEANRASYTLAALRLSKRYGVRTVVWYQLYYKFGRPHPRVWDSGLLSWEGVTTPLYRRLVAARPSLVGF